MAQSINDPAAKRPRGRPKKAPISGAPGERKEAADKAVAIIESTGKPQSQSAKAADAKAGKTHTGPPAADKPAPAAKGFGANMVTADVFLSHVHQLNRIEEELASAKLVVKEINGRKKDARQLAKADGIVLKEMDEAIENSKTDRVDHVAREERRRFYHEFLGIPLVQGDLFELDPSIPTLDQDKLKWRAIGNTDGRAGRPCKAPDYCPPICLPEYEDGYKDGQKVAMQKSPLTAGAFNDDGSVKGEAKPDDQVDTWVDPKDEAKPAADPPKAEAIVVFQNDAFLDTVKGPDDCSRATLAFADSRQRWDAAERVLVLFKDPETGTAARRVLKAPAKGVEGEAGYEPAYEDLGEPDGVLTDAEPVADLDAELDALVAAGKGDDQTFGGAPAQDLGAEMIEAIAEVEPELVDQVLADHGEGEGGEFE